MAPYAGDNTSLHSSRDASLQHASNPTAGRKLAQLVSKFETMELTGSRAGSSKLKSMFHRPPLPASKTMSSLTKTNPSAASNVQHGLTSPSASPSKQNLNLSGSVQHLPIVTLYPPEPRKVEGERPHAKSTVAETRKLFEPAPPNKVKKAFTPTKIIKNPLRSSQSTETVLFSYKRPLKRSHPSSLNHVAECQPRSPATTRKTEQNCAADGVDATVKQTRPSKIATYHDSHPGSRQMTSNRSSYSASTTGASPPYQSIDEAPFSDDAHHQDQAYTSVKTGHPRIMGAVGDAVSSFSHFYERLPSHSPAEASSRNATSVIPSLESDVSESTPLAARQPQYSALPRDASHLSSSRTPSVADCSSPDREITLFQRGNSALEDGAADDPDFVAPPTKDWTPQRIVTPQKATVSNYAPGTEPKQCQGTFARGQAPPTLRETIGLFESMSYRGSLSAACQTTAREPAKPAAEEIKIPKRSARGNTHQKIKESLRNLSSTWGRKSAKRDKQADPFSEYPTLWKVDSVKSRTGKAFHTPFCELSQQHAKPYEKQNIDKPMYESYSSARKAWDSWARDRKEGLGIYDDYGGYKFTSLHTPVIKSGREKPTYVEETSSVFSTDTGHATQEAIEAARRRSRRWLSRSSGTLVSQAHCKLEQPKPVHANEVKRLISLCKTRVVGHKRRGNTE